MAFVISPSFIIEMKLSSYFHRILLESKKVPFSVHEPKIGLARFAERGPGPGPGPSARAPSPIHIDGCMSRGSLNFNLLTEARTEGRYFNHDSRSEARTSVRIRAVIGEVGYWLAACYADAARSS